MRKTGRHELVVQKIKQLLTIIEVVEMNKEVVFEALNSAFRDFEDALQNFAAVQNENISFVLTRNVKDFRESKLIVMTPERYLRTKNEN